MFRSDSVPSFKRMRIQDLGTTRPITRHIANSAHNLHINWNFNCELANDILYTLELLCKNTVVLNYKPIQRKLLSHSWLDTKQQQQHNQFGP